MNNHCHHQTICAYKDENGDWHKRDAKTCRFGCKAFIPVVWPGDAKEIADAAINAEREEMQEWNRCVNRIAADRPATNNAC